MPDQQLMQTILQMIWHADLQMPKRGYLVHFTASAIRRQPAQPLGDAEDMRIDSETRPLQTEENHAGGGFGPNAGVAR